MLTLLSDVKRCTLGLLLLHRGLRSRDVHGGMLLRRRRHCHAILTWSLRRHNGADVEGPVLIGILWVDVAIGDALLESRIIELTRVVIVAIVHLAHRRVQESRWIRGIEHAREDSIRLLRPTSHGGGGEVLGIQHLVRYEVTQKSAVPSKFIKAVMSQ